MAGGSMRPLTIAALSDAFTISRAAATLGERARVLLHADEVIE
jgi:hypothetical protein